MFSYLVFLVLALAVNSAPFPSPTATEFPAQGDSLDFEWAAANVSLNGSSFSVDLNERVGDSLSDVWDLPAGLLFCNFSSENTINHNYVTTLVNGLYAGMANSALLRASSGELWKATHNLGVRQGTQICRSHPSSIERFPRCCACGLCTNPDQSFATSASTMFHSVLPSTTSSMPS